MTLLTRDSRTPESLRDYPHPKDFESHHIERKRCRLGRNRSGLRIATAFDLASILAKLLNEGMDVETRDGKGRTPLHIDVIYGSHAAAPELLGRKAYIEATMCMDLTPLTVAASFGRVEIATELLANKANFNA